MKYLLGFLVMLLLAWRWRIARSAKQLDTQRQPSAMRAQVEMVRCHQCGVHIPTTEAIPGAHGTYCSIAHRQKMES